MELRKWCANDPSLLEAIPRKDREAQIDVTEIEGVPSTAKTLGILWDAKTDKFALQCSKATSTKITKRTILADISRLFDPLGFVNPVIVLAKILLQEIWAHKFDWDAALPQVMTSKWATFRQELDKLNTLSIPRFVLQDGQDLKIQIHGFADASEKAFGACVYLRSVDQHDKIHCHLLCAKSRVAPLKKQTLARLELCAAKLLAQLVKRTVEALGIKINQTFFWTDSTIVLAWIGSATSSMDTFIANRVAEVQRLSTINQWHHVDSKKNPADFVSRGMYPDQLIKSFWFTGPEFLYTTEDKWPKQCPEAPVSMTPLKLKPTTLMMMEKEEHFIHSINHRNSFHTLRRIVAFIFRFIKNCKTSSSVREGTADISARELLQAESFIIKQIQSEAFHKEIKQLKSRATVDSSSALSTLTPFLDEDSIIRVGGRLQASNLAYNNKHPAVLPYTSPLTKLLITELHLKNLHAGPQALLAITRQNYWPLKGKRMAQSIVQQCILCARAKPKTLQQLMGNLPGERVVQSRPFLNVGIDFGGPIYIHYKIRGKRPTKAYIAVFVCLTTKATHFEVVSDLTTAAFIGALKRFIARRGRPAKILCDNATNFVGARKELEDLHNLFMSSEHQKLVQRSCADDGIEWSHIPPRSPHFGGIWEAAIKSAKHHLKRVLQGANLTFEELCTVMAEIEAILNSRPLTPLSNDPNELEALTPGHFLIGAPLTKLAEPNAAPSKETNMAHWNRVRAIQNEFWRRWSSEYLQELQNRYKWKRPLKDIEIGTLVILKEDNLPPLKWRMGIIVGTRKGPDGLSRVVDVKTSTGECQRAVHRVCPLPVKDDSYAEHSDTQIPRNTTYNSKRINHPLKGRFLPISRPPLKELEPQPKRAKTATVSLPKAMLTLLLLTFLPGTSKAINYTDTLRNKGLENKDNYAIIYPKPGFYIEQMGMARIRRGTFRIELTFPGSYIVRDEEGVNKTIEQMENMCNQSLQLAPETHCDNMIHHLMERQLKILKNIQIIKNIHGTRSKRGLLGKFMQAVFGVNDEIYKDVDALSQNQQHLLQITNRQNALLFTTKASLEENQSQLSKKLEHFTAKLNKGIEAINNMQTWYSSIDKNKLSIQILATYQAASNYLEEITERYEGIVAALFNRSNILDFLPISKVSETLEKASSKLPASIEILRFPQNKLELKHQEEDLLIFGFFDIAERDNYNLIKVTPVPHKIKNNTYSTFHLSSSALAIDYNNQLYYELSDKELQQCTNIGKFKFLCSTTVVKSIDSQPNCVIDQIYQRHEQTYCPTEQFTVTQNLWKHLYMANTWLFIAETSTPVALLCKGIRQEITLKATGIIKTKQDCVIETRGSTLKTEINSNLPVHSTFIHEVNVSNYMSKHNESSRNKINIEPILKASDQFPGLQRVPDIEPESNFRWRTIGHHVASSSITIFIIAAGLITAVKLWGKGIKCS